MTVPINLGAWYKIVIDMEHQGCGGDALSLGSGYDGTWIWGVGVDVCFLMLMLMLMFKVDGVEDGCVRGAQLPVRVKSASQSERRVPQFSSMSTSVRVASMLRS